MSPRVGAVSGLSNLPEMSSNLVEMSPRVGAVSGLSNLVEMSSNLSEMSPHMSPHLRSSQPPPIITTGTSTPSTASTISNNIRMIIAG